jgi:hypothetical protein
MAMIRWARFIIGAVTFAGTHLIEVAMWQTWFGGSHEPWFLNSGRAAAFTAGCLLLVSTMVASPDRQESIIGGCNIAAGAFLGMVIVLFATGPGSIFPIVLFAGALIAAASAVSGTIAGWGLRRLVRQSTRR